MLIRDHVSMKDGSRRSKGCSRGKMARRCHGSPLTSFEDKRRVLSRKCPRPKWGIRNWRLMQILLPVWHPHVPTMIRLHPSGFGVCHDVSWCVMTLVHCLVRLFLSTPFCPFFSPMGWVHHGSWYTHIWYIYIYVCPICVYQLVFPLPKNGPDHPLLRSANYSASCTEWSRNSPKTGRPIQWRRTGPVEIVFFEIYKPTMYINDINTQISKYR